MAELRPTSNWPKRSLAAWISLALALGTLLIYWPVTKCQFVNYDDTDFVTANPRVQAGFTAESFKWAWTSEVARNWHPVTMLAHMLDCQLFGLKPAWHHFSNLLLHLANAVLLFHLLLLLTGAPWRSGFVAALFAWHPVHVESVAWIAERKDVLSTFFWFLSIIAYVSYARNLRVANGREKWFYILSVFLFALGLMSKPMVVTGPFVLLLIDFWPLNRMARTKPGAKKSQAVEFHFPLRLVWEKIPFLCLSAALCVITYLIQKHGGAMLSDQNLSFVSRADNALVSYVRYLGKIFWPANLAGLYLRTGEWPGWLAIVCGLLVLAVSIFAFTQWRGRPWLTVGWFWYLGILAPVIGIVQVGMQTMADRFTYVPSIGIFIIVTWTACELACAWKLPPAALMPAAVVILATCAVLTPRQIGYWRDSETLFKRMIAVTPGNFMAHYNLANFYAHENRPGDAEAHYQAALAEEPNYADAHNNYAGLLLSQKRYDEAIHHYREAARINPQFLFTFNLANALADSASAHRDAAEFTEAVQTYRQAIRMNPNSADAHLNLGLTWDAQGREAGAAAEFAEAVRLNPGLEPAHFHCAEALAHLGRLNEAIAEYQAAIQLDPSQVENYNGLGVCYAMKNDMPGAGRQFEKVIQLQPGNAAAQGNLGNALAAQNRIDAAIPHYLEALRLNPADYQTEFNLGLSLAREGKRAEAGGHYERALRINPNYTAARQALAELKK